MVGRYGGQASYYVGAFGEDTAVQQNRILASFKQVQPLRAYFAMRVACDEPSIYSHVSFLRLDASH